MNKTLVAEYQSLLWLMEPQALEGFVQRLAGLPGNAQLPQIAVAQKRAELTVSEGVARIPIKGVLLDSVPGWLRLWGITATGYDEIVAQVNEAAGRDDVTAIELDVDSPGGMVAGIAEAANAIFKARGTKKVKATITNLGASGAYWLASQAERIEAADLNTLAGSIGVYTWFVDWTGYEEKMGVKVIVVRSGEHKGMGLDTITENQIAAVQEYIDATAANFIDAVAEGRGRKNKEIAELATGQLWIAKAALELGLIDALIDSRRQPAQANSHIQGDSIMDPTQTEQSQTARDAAIDPEKLRSEAQTAERNRLADLKTAFADDLSFAVESFEKGLSVEQAKAAYCDVLRERIKSAPAKKDEPKSSAGAPPLPAGDGDGDSNGGDFMAAARELAAEKGITMTAAMRQIRRRQPQLHAAFKARCESEGHQMYAEAV